MPVARLKERIIGSLRFRLSLLITLLTAFLTIAFTSYYIKHERSSYTSQLKMKGMLLADILAPSLLTPLYAGNNEEVALHTSEIFTQGDIYSVKVYGSRNELIASAARSQTRSDVAGPTITKPITSGYGQYAPESLLLGEESSARTVGRIELQMDASHLAVLTRNLLIGSSLLALLFWAVTTALTFIMMQRVTATFQLLMAGVKNIENGDLTARIPVDKPDEPGRALTAINSLAEALQKRNEENERLQAEVVQGLRLQIDEEKNRYMAKLIQTNRMTSLGLLVSSMAHEINNPNGAIRLAAEILDRAWHDIEPVLAEVIENEGEIKICGMSSSDAVEDIEKAIEAITRSSIRIERVVLNLRSYSLGDRENQHIVYDLNRVAENSLSIVRAHGNMANIEVNTALTAVIPAITGNPFQLEQVVINLLMNAIQAMAINGGKLVTVSTMFDSTANEVVLVVKDSGPGIKSANLPHIFEPFFSTRINEGGSGLGLYIARFIIQEQNGTLEMFNGESGGCRAVIRLPVTKKSVTPPPSPLIAASC